MSEAIQFDEEQFNEWLDAVYDIMESEFDRRSLRNLDHFPFEDFFLDGVSVEQAASIAANQVSAVPL
jgi:hypothetical protein